VAPILAGHGVGYKIACGEWARLVTHGDEVLQSAPMPDCSVWAPIWFVLVSTGSSPESGLRVEGATTDIGMKDLRGQTKHERGTGQRGPDHDRGPDRQGEDSSVTCPRHDRRPAHAGMTDPLDVMFDKLRDAAAAHDD
jgi:hypothetical protein